jgi:REP element-mobilizing transposase RayT
MRIVQRIKQQTSKQLREKYFTIRETRKTEDFWATGYYCGTAGHVSAEQVARYIFQQTRNLKDQFNLFGLKPFEYHVDLQEYMPTA